jgi:hypothetical protein
MEISETELIIDRYRIKQELKITRYFLLFFIVICIILVLIAILKPNIKTFSFLNKNTQDLEINATMEGLSQSEIALVKEWVNELKPEYKELAQTVVFTKNWSYLNPTNKTRTVGTNFNGSIYIYLDSDDYADAKDTICHELLHFIVHTEEGIDSEWFVRDLSKYEVCYK